MTDLSNKFLNHVNWDTVANFVSSELKIDWHKKTCEMTCSFYKLVCSFISDLLRGSAKILVLRDTGKNYILCFSVE